MNWLGHLITFGKFVSVIAVILLLVLGSLVSLAIKSTKGILK